MHYLSGLLYQLQQSGPRVAEWIAWQLEQVGYKTTVRAWDFRPGANFVLEMQRAASEAGHTIAVLSPDYLTALFTQPEWAAALAQDPTGDHSLVFFFADVNIVKNVLGRRGWLDRLNVGIVDHDQLLYFSSYDASPE